MSSIPSFEAIYEKLNKQQKLAVDAIEGPVLVAAGPGTGKTHVLATRIANILRLTDCHPNNILALTFTEAAAKNMRQRVVKLIGNQGYGVEITTFHSFCSSVIKQHPEYFEIDPDSKPLAELERYQIFENLILSVNLDLLKPLNRNFHFLKKMIENISNLKKETISPQKFQTVLDDLDPQTSQMKKDGIKDYKKQKELSLIYEAYQKKLVEERRYDFDDMINLVIEAFEKNHDLLLEYQEVFQYFLTDEYQDTNSSQNRILELLASYWGDKANVFVVGDPHQSIFRFQGASVENMLQFIDLYPKALVVTLEKGYRCPPLIYQASHQLIKNNLEQNEMNQLLDRVTVLLRSDKPQTESSLQLNHVSNQFVEAFWVAKKIAKLLASGVNASQIAVLYRKHYEANIIKEVLSSFKIPIYQVRADSVLDHSTIRQLLNLLRVIIDLRLGKESERLFEVLSYEWLGLPLLTLAKTSRAAGKLRVTIPDLLAMDFDTLSKLYPYHQLVESEIKNLQSKINLLYQWGVEDLKMLFPIWFEKVITESGYVAWAKSKEGDVSPLTALYSLFQFAKDSALDRKNWHLQDFLNSVAVMEAHNISIEPIELKTQFEAVTLSTAHGAKGLEWEYVFVIQCLDKKWGNSRENKLISLPEGLIQEHTQSKHERNQEERRLMYVALTRASKRLYLTIPEQILDSGVEKNQMESMFVSEIAEFVLLVEQQENQEIIKMSDDYFEKMIAPTPTKFNTVSIRSFLKETTQNFILNIHALNSYLRSPEEFIERYLLKVPRITTEHMAFGSAVHSGLDFWHQHYLKTGRHPRLLSILEKYENALKKHIILESDFKTRLVYGKKILTTYFEKNQTNSLEIAYSERSFGTPLRHTVLGSIALNGRIDRIDWQNKNKGVVQIIDYKTGNHKSENEILGLTKSAQSQLSVRERSLPDTIRGPIKRQLLFYKLLTQLDPTFRHSVEEGLIDFVEFDKKSGKHIQRVFVLPDDEVQQLVELIKEVTSEIRALKFL